MKEIYTIFIGFSILIYRLGINKKEAIQRVYKLNILQSIIIILHFSQDRLHNNRWVNNKKTLNIIIDI